MNVLIVGSGGREHALAWKCAQSVDVDRVYVAPGNAGTILELKLINVDIAADNTRALIEFAQDNQVDLTIIGPEGPLVSGIVDAFGQAGLPCFGPNKDAAILEGSKSYSKDFLKRHNIPTAKYEVFEDLENAKSYIHEQGVPIVIKADGLAAGKGVVVASTLDQALDTVIDMLSENKFGEAGHRVVIEEFLEGEEASFIVMTDGNTILPMATSQDHKARDKGDKGPNTGGMGAYSPAPVINENMYVKIMKEVIEPTIEGMKRDGRTYTGFLYAGLMISSQGDIKVLEYNCRLGDPETQPIMMRLKSDLVGLCVDALAGNLALSSGVWDERAALGIVAAADGYPDSPSKGDSISGLDLDFGNEVKVFHAGTAQADGNIITSGGRVLCVTALGHNVTVAQQAALSAIDRIHYRGIFFRRDIGYRAIQREQSRIKS
ncbi:MAG: phosphoribosylamine--glycine ligase [Gammaproteobacteria bacterium]|jgi:phosphoribosylamine--glycine ligase